MAIDLSKPLAWKKRNADEEAMLKDLQGNILKGHGRDFTYNMFLHFDAGKRDTAKKFVACLADQLPSALDQLKATEVHKASGASAPVFTAFFLTARGYGALGRADLKPTLNAAPFENGLKTRAGDLLDPPVETWNETFQGDLHAMLLIADDSEAARNEHLHKVLALIAQSAGAVAVLGTEEGRAMRNPDGHGIEHFGYVDGRSQPLVLLEDWEDERDNKGGVDHWDPKIPLARVLVPCPGSYPHSHGSYFVFRKLEQNVRGFKKDEKRLAKFLELSKGIDNSERADEAEELSGAMVVGRFENGQPVSLQSEAGDLKNKNVPNNFTFKNDESGLKCPLAGHIRKANPRGQTESKFGVPVGTEINHLMARRGITYGLRAVQPNDPALRFEDMPTGDVGLLFMAYQSNLEDQFEFTQRSWVNNPQFISDKVGIDPVIGQSSGNVGQQWPQKWGGPLKAEPFDFSRWVTMLGGEYFFAPCISMLKAL